MQDYLTIKENKGDEIFCLLTRSIIFYPIDKNIKGQNEITASHDVVLTINENITNSEFISDVKNNLDILNRVFEILSLTIANISTSSVWGPIITSPMYDPKDIKIN